MKPSRLAANLEHLFKTLLASANHRERASFASAAGGFRPLFTMNDRDLVQLVCALANHVPAGWDRAQHARARAAAAMRLPRSE